MTCKGAQTVFLEMMEVIYSLFGLVISWVYTCIHYGIYSCQNLQTEHSIFVHFFGMEIISQEIQINMKEKRISDQTEEIWEQ